MFTNLLSIISNWIIHVIQTLGYPGVLILMGIQSAAIPLPSEVILPFAGFLVTQGRFTILGLALFGGIGSTIGASVAYALGYYGGRKLISRYGRFVLISETDLNLTEKFFKKFRFSSIFLGQLLPVVRTFIAIPAGVARMPFLGFSLSVFFGSFIWSYFLAWVGFRLGQHWNSLQIYFRKFDSVILMLFLIGVCYWLYRHIRKLN